MPYSKTCQTAAKLFGGNTGLLDADLYNHLDTFRHLPEDEEAAKPFLEIIIRTWADAHPDRKPYYYGG